MAGTLVLGGSGRLGGALVAMLPEVHAPPSSQVNLLDEDSMAAAIDRLEPELIINCAAMTDVDACERDGRGADAMNGQGPGRLAKRAAAAGVPIVQVSTDYVFSGHPREALGEDRPVEPINRYGQSKARGEGLVLDSGAEALVVRVQWLFGGANNDFVRFVRGRLLAGQPVPVVADQVGVPSYTEDLAVQLWLAASRRWRGLLHIGNGGEVSRLDQARSIAAAMGLEGQFELVTWAQLGRPAARPARSVLDTSRMAGLMAEQPVVGADGGAELPHWRAAQARYLESLKEAS